MGNYRFIPREKGGKDLPRILPEEGYTGRIICLEMMKEHDRLTFKPKTGLIDGDMSFIDLYAVNLLGDYPNCYRRNKLSAFSDFELEVLASRLDLPREDLKEVKDLEIAVSSSFERVSSEEMLREFCETRKEQGGAGVEDTSF